ncbi:hypothetical protein [Chryseobacterium aquaeductus]|nr:hypothetical protein [Chryseobacterium aquaeductus]
MPNTADRKSAADIFTIEDLALVFNNYAKHKKAYQVIEKGKYK